MRYNTLDFRLGDILSICNSSEILADARAFAALSSCDYEFICKCIGNILSSDATKDQKVKAALLLTANHLTSGNNKKRAREVFSKIKNETSEVSGWQSDLFANLAQIFLTYLDPKYANLLKKKSSELGGKILIGDSHVICIAGINASFFDQVTYIPGVQMKNLTSPQPNLKRLGLENSFSFSYELKNLYFSIGEIDYRLAKLCLRDDIALASTQFDTIKRCIRPFIQYINSLKAPHQNLNFILPPVFWDSSSMSEYTDKFLRVNYDECDIIFSEEVKKSSANLIKYKLPSRGIVIDNDLIDHAHFKPPIYAELFT